MRGRDSEGGGSKPQNKDEFLNWSLLLSTGAQSHRIFWEILQNTSQNSQLGKKSGNGHQLASISPSSKVGTGTNSPIITLCMPGHQAAHITASEKPQDRTEEASQNRSMAEKLVEA